MNFSKQTTEHIENAEKLCENDFKIADEIALFNQMKVLNAFKTAGVEMRHFAGTSGYGYDDAGKTIANKIYSLIFNTEAAIVSPAISCGTTALYHTLFGVLRPKDTIYCISGTPYDTLHDIIFSTDKSKFSLQDLGVKYIQSNLIDSNFNYSEIKKNISKYKPKVIYIQRSRGYEFRDSLCIEKIEKVCRLIKQNCSSYIIVDNCYGTFCEIQEPTDAGADLVVGSLIKNAGGGYAQNGAYIAGKNNLIQLINNHIYSPALGDEVGSYINGYKSILQGIFVAPSVVRNCKKTALLCSAALSGLGYETLPKPNQPVADIVASIKFNDKQKLIKFCQSIQSFSPIDSFAVPQPWDMPGYENQVIMAGGTFVQGSTVELSCDGPIREPYVAYLQGSLTYEHGKLALINALEQLI